MQGFKPFWYDGWVSAFKRPSRVSTITSKALRPQLTQVLDQVGRGQRVVIAKYRSSVAAIVPYGDFVRLQQLDQDQRHRAATEAPMHVISVYNQAGGAGKTTVTRDLGYALSGLGLRVLLIDLDPQASLTRWLGLLNDTEDGQKSPALKLDRTVFPVLTDPDADLPEPLTAYGMDVVPANTKLSVGDSVLYDDQERLGYLRNSIRRLQGYDMVLIDVPPGRTAMAMAGVAASDHLLIPVNVSKALDNIDNVAEVLKLARRFSPNIAPLALVPHSFMKNTRHHKDVLRGLTEDLASLAPTTTPIAHKDVLYDDATLYQQPVAVYAPRNSAVQDYRTLASEVLGLLKVAVPAVGGRE